MSLEIKAKDVYEGDNGGKVALLDGLRILSVQGTPEQIGAQAAELTPTLPDILEEDRLIGDAQVQAGVDLSVPHFLGLNRAIGWLARKGASASARWHVRDLLEPYTSKDFMDMTLAVDAQLGRKPGTYFNYVCGVDVMEQLMTTLKMGCTAFAARGEGGRWLTGSNFDYIRHSPGLNDLTMMLVKQDGRLPSVYVGPSGLVLCAVRRMTKASRGYTAGSTNIALPANVSEGRPMGCSSVELSRHWTVANALKDFELFSHGFGSLELLIGPDGAALVEVSPQGSTVTRGRDNGGKLIATNHYLSSEREGLVIPAGILNSRVRAARVSELMESGDASDPMYALQILLDCAGGGRCGFGIGQSHAVNPLSNSTLPFGRYGSMIFDNEGNIYVTPTFGGDTTHGVAYGFTFDDLLRLFVDGDNVPYDRHEVDAPTGDAHQMLRLHNQFKNAITRFYSQKDPQGALLVLSSRDFDNDPEAVYHRALCHDALRDPQEADKAYRKVLELEEGQKVRPWTNAALYKLGRERDIDTSAGQELDMFSIMGADAIRDNQNPYVRLDHAA